jgi:L-fuculose-phosphate aldolase
VSGHDDLLLGPERRAVLAHALRLQLDRLTTSTSGNLSARRGDLIAITPSGTDYAALTPETIGVHRVDGTPVDAPLAPSTEAPFHLAIYASTPARAVVHTHPLHATVLSTLLDELPPIHYLMALFGGPPRVAPYATFGSQQLAEGVVEALGDRSAVLLANHGAITTGTTLKQAYTNALYLEWMCELVVKARLLGEPRLLSPEELAVVAERLQGYRQA